jgi:hypothetical protein
MRLMAVHVDIISVPIAGMGRSQSSLTLGVDSYSEEVIAVVGKANVRLLEFPLNNPFPHRNSGGK